MNKRISGILEYLLKNNGISALSDIASSVNASERTIRYDIYKINEELEKNSFPPIKRISKGIFQSDIESLNFIINSYSSNTIPTQQKYKDILILIKVSFDEKINIANLCTEFDLSRTTIKTSLNRIKEILNFYSLTLIVDPQKGLKLTGEEDNLRRLQLKLLNQYKKNHDDNSLENRVISNYLTAYLKEYLEDIENVETITLFIKYVTNSFKRVIADDDFIILSNYILITIIRIKKSKSLSNGKNENFFSNTNEYEFINKFIPLIENMYNIDFNKHELLKLTDYFLGSHSYSLSKDNFNNWIELDILTQQLINEFSKISNYDISHDSSLLDGLSNHIKPALYRTKNKIELENSILDEFLNLYPDIFDFTKQALILFEDFLNEKIGDEEVAFIGMHFKAAIDRINSTKSEIKNLLIVCGFGYGTSKLLSQQIREIYNVNIVATIPFNQVEFYLKNNKIDMIITTLTNFNFVTPIPIISIKTLLNNDDLAILESYNLPKYSKRIFLSDILEKLDPFLNVADNKELIATLKDALKEVLIDDIKQPLQKLSSTLKDNMIIINSDISSWEDAISTSGEILVDNNFTDVSYTEDMIENIKKNGLYSILSNNIAIPHAKNNDNVFKTGISLIVFKNPVIFPGNIPIDIIFAFSSYDGKEHLPLLTEFIELLKKTDFIKTIKSLNSSKKVIKFIQKFEFLNYFGK